MEAYEKAIRAVREVGSFALICYLVVIEFPRLRQAIEANTEAVNVALRLLGAH